MNGSGLAGSSERPPRLSILIPTYNRPAMLREAVESVLQQTSADWNLLVGVDGEEHAKETLAALPQDPRVVVNVFRKNRGTFATYTRLMAQNRTEDYILFFSDDDRLRPEFVEHVLAAIRRASAPPQFNLVQTDYFVSEGESLSVVHKENINNMVFRKDRLPDPIFFTENLRYLGDMVLIARTKSPANLELKEPLVVSRKHPGQLSRRTPFGVVLAQAATARLLGGRMTLRKTLHQLRWCFDTYTHVSTVLRKIRGEGTRSIPSG